MLPLALKRKDLLVVTDGKKRIKLKGRFLASQTMSGILPLLADRDKVLALDQMFLRSQMLKIAQMVAPSKVRRFRKRLKCRKTSTGSLSKEILASQALEEYCPLEA